MNSEDKNFQIVHNSIISFFLSFFLSSFHLPNFHPSLPPKKTKKNHRMEIENEINLNSPMIVLPPIIISSCELKPNSSTWESNFNVDISFNKEKCCIKGCGINASVRCFRSLVGNWTLKRDCPHLKNSRSLKICDIHYITDLKRYRSQHGTRKKRKKLSRVFEIRTQRPKTRFSKKIMITKGKKFQNRKNPQFFIQLLLRAFNTIEDDQLIQFYKKKLKSIEY